MPLTPVGSVARWVYRVLVLLLLYPALVITAVRVLQLDAGPAIRLESFTPLALPLYAAALVLLVTGAWRARRGDRARRTTRGVGALVALVGLGLHAWWISPSFVGDAPAPAAGADPLVVMTANLYEGQVDVDDLLATVRREHVDVLALEEISMDALASADAGGLAQLLPHRIGGPNGYDPVSGTMVLSTMPLGAPVPVETYHDSWLVPVGEDLTVMAVHPVAPVTPEQWTTDHATILAAAEQAEPDVVLGDFNATTDHQPMRALDAAGFHDAAELVDAGWEPTWPANGLGQFPGVSPPPLVAIDHVLVGERWTALETHTVDLAGTDHLALVATLAPR